MAHIVSPYEDQTRPATYKGQPVLTAIEIRFPETFSDRAWHVIEEYGNSIQLYVHNGMFVATTELRALDVESVRWQGGSLEDLEIWLEVKATQFDELEPGWEDAYVS